MIRLLTIEWLKLKRYKAFNILMILYYVVMISVCSCGMAILSYLKGKGLQIKDVFDPTLIPIYDFPDIWQNITYIATLLNVFPAFMIIISMTNEVSYRTLRQNIIDGFNRMDFFVSKFSFIFLVSIINTLVIFITGLILGFIFSYDKSFEAIFSSSEFLLGFFLNNLAYFTFAFLLAILIKRTGIVIVLLGIYTYFAEPIATLILANVPEFPRFCREIVPFFPIKAVNNLIPNPFLRYAFMEITDTIPLKSLLIVIGQLGAYLTFIWLLLKKRDV
jgi:ABC-2 type transport system permease protein